ncbi:MAG TPA: hypothetical protein DD381_02455 [Lentisphaeria bacterium]|nr:MAG: hypothetical protein A2X47_08580 [Lentisphaerae bacterium GWF2_38_69]HBM15196.1 hypothetical protein [Lentisphaeria bacterium]
MLLKLGANDLLISISGKSVTVKFSLILVLGFIFYLISFFTWVYILKTNTLTFILPILIGALYILIILGSFFFLKETISFYQWIGIGIVLIGIVLMNIK